MTGSNSQEPDDSLGADAAELCLVRILALPEERRGAALAGACEREPALADELRERWQALAALGLAGAPAPPTCDGFPESLGDFDLLERLGAGGMGVVYRARQRSLEREVALKLLRPEALYFERSRERFRREVTAIAGLRHPSIVPVHAVGEERGVPFFAMELIEGATLAELLARLRGRAPSTLTGCDLARALGPPEALPRPETFELGWSDACAEIARQVAEALEHAHGRGILHRDVKPSNVALTRDGRARLFDFGLAVSVGGERLTQTGGQLGTLHYMSPEQVRGDAALGARSDVYSLGVTLYEMLALEVPFAGGTRTQLESRILAGGAAPLQKLNPRVSRELALVCAKAMEVDPARRYPSARAFADDLAAALRRLPVSAHAPTAAYRARRWVQRNPALAAAAAAAFGLFGVAPSVLLWRERAHLAELSAAYAEESRALEAERAALEAERTASSEARDALAFLEGLFQEVTPHKSGNPDARVRDVLQRGAELLPGFAASPRLEGRLAIGLASAMVANSMHLDALPLAERALALEEQHEFLLDTSHNRPAEIVAACLGVLGRREEAAAALSRAIERERDPEVEIRMRFLLGRGLVDLGRGEEALECFGRVRDYYGEGTEQDREQRMAIAYGVSQAQRSLGRPEQALAEAEQGRAIAAALYPAGHYNIAQGLRLAAIALVDLGECDRALEHMHEVLAVGEASFGRGSFPDMRNRAELAYLLSRCGRAAEAADFGQQVAELRAEHYGADSPQAEDARRKAREYAEAAERR